jgi:hypothetical protein
MVPEEGIEPPTFGLQNRCSTAELFRQRVRHIAVSVSTRNVHVNPRSNIARDQPADFALARLPSILGRNQVTNPIKGRKEQIL